MNGKRIALLGLLQALGTGLYAALVVTVIFIIGSLAEEDIDDAPLTQILAPIAFLMSFIISACISGAMVLGYPIVLDAWSNMGFGALLLSSIIPLGQIGGLMLLAMFATSLGALTLLASALEIFKTKIR